MFDKPQSPLALVDKVLCFIENLMMAALVMFALGLGLLEVILRYVFNSGIPWSEGVLIFCIIWAMFFAASRAIRDKVHPRVELVPLILPPALRAAINLVSITLSLLLSLFFAYCGLLYVQFTYSIGSIDTATGIPDIVIFSIIPLSMSIFVVRYLFVLGRQLKHFPRDISY